MAPVGLHSLEARIATLRNEMRLQPERVDRRATAAESFEQAQHARAMLGIAGLPAHVIVIDELRAGRGRRVLKPGHAFGRIHRDDITGAVLAAILQSPPPGLRVLHLADDEPAEPARVIEEAASLLGLPPPPATPFAQALAGMSPMARSFWAENRRVGSTRTQAALDYRWRYPSYREGLRAILEQQRGDDAGEQGEIVQP